LLEIEVITIEVAGSSMVAAYLCKIAQDKFKCPRASDYLVSRSKDSELTEFIRRQDQGGLLYPCDQLISVVVTVSKLFEEYWPTIREWKNCAAGFKRSLLQPLKNSGLIPCGCEDLIHSQQLQDFLIDYLVKVLLQNKANTLTDAEDQPHCRMKPLSRKILKLS